MLLDDSDNPANNPLDDILRAVQSRAVVVVAVVAVVAVADSWGTERALQTRQTTRTN